jgi:hypothetical protein
MKKKALLGIVAAIITILFMGIYLGTFVSTRNPPHIPILGVCLHLYQYDDDTVNQLEQLNSSWVRIDWIPNKMDYIIPALKENRIKILAILDHNTMNFAEPPNPNFTLSEWATTLNEIMSTDVSKQVDAWEIWNEPNVQQFYSGYMNGTPQNYFEMLKVAHEIIYSNSPDSLVIAAGLSPDEKLNWSEWLAVFSSLSPQPYFDYQGVHLYNDAKANLNIIKQAKQIMKVDDVWITEIGKPSAPVDEGFSAENQATYLISNFQMLNCNVRCPVFWYQLKDETGASLEKENHFGLFDFLNNPKTSFDAFIEFTYQK